MNNSNTSTPIMLGGNLSKMTTPLQKGIGIVALAGICYVLGQIFVPLILGAIVLVGIVARKPIWDGINIAVWHSTKWLIKNNVVYYLNKCYEILEKEFNEFAEARKQVGTDMLVAEQGVSKLIEDRHRAIEMHARVTDERTKNEYAAEVAVIKEQLDMLMPTLEVVKNQYNIMEQIEDMRRSDLKVFRIRLDAQIRKYEILKNMNSASSKANKFVGSNSSAEKTYMESAKQLQQSVAQYMINIEDVNKKMIPELQKFSATNQYNQDKGREIIEAYKQSRIGISLDEK